MKKIILIILTSHRKDCFALCIHNLERYTNLSFYKQVYILANAVDDDHAALIAEVKSRHNNISDVHFGPRGIRATIAAEGMILENHRNDIIVKIDEDVFVTENWLDPLLKTYYPTCKSNIVLLSSLVPNNQIGKYCLHKVLEELFPGITSAQCMQDPACENPRYAEIIWTLFKNGYLRNANCPIIQRCHDTPFVGGFNINCILFDNRLTRLILPFKTTDENDIYVALRDNNLMGLMITKSLAHHYSFKHQQQHIDMRIGITSIARVFGGLSKIRSMS